MMIFNQDLVKSRKASSIDNIKNYNGEIGKKAVLKTTGPIAYSKAILSLLSKHRTYQIDSPVREYKLSEEIGLSYMDTSLYHHSIYEGYDLNEPLILSDNKHINAYVLYANENYFNILKTCIKSIREFSKFPIYVYMLNSDLKIDIDNVTTIRWNCNTKENEGMYVSSTNSNVYINRSNEEIYKLLIQRPLVVKHALTNFAKNIAYIDCDSIVTPYVDKIFTYFDTESPYPYLTEGIFDWMTMGDRGGAMTRNDLSTTLEHPVCELFGIDQYVRQTYRQTGYFVAGQKCIDFLDEWYWMCIHPKILKNLQKQR
jgi:hypothetical protein